MPDEINISGTFSFSGAITFEDAVFEECGEEVTLSGSISFSGESSFDCEGNETFTISIFTDEACSGITAVDGDGTTHDIGMEMSEDETGAVTGSTCIDGEEVDPTEMETACNEDSCEMECAAALKSTTTDDSSDDSSSCESACEGDDDGTFEDDGTVDDGDDTESGCTTDAECQDVVSSADGVPADAVEATMCLTDSGECEVDCNLTSDSAGCETMATDNDADCVEGVCTFTL